MRNSLHEFNWPLLIAAVLFAMGAFASIYMINHVDQSAENLGIFE